MSFLLRFLTWWNSQTLNTQFWTWRNGVKVGEDAVGNIFYKTADGKRRWVIYNAESEASQISPEWHGWLHHTWNEAPTELAVPRREWEQPHQPNLTGTPGAYVPAGSLYRAQPAVRSDYDAWRPE
ncbi:NADH:ubiquinone oxidoreductase subunit NDUFA12 [Paracoccus hibiscisoli]|uniref:NADH:ubiquinone oxidoreductase subunit NDUFA12 n=1 Tax=Paracoccus hibiscisoli TaxID=2023261 RepID=A0A4U0QPY4_9RHOB|nr:NADH:ubiquinone oxidoreductase subunit NDUFA12 [Paracoccus hibiscisoli]TJZ83981.1 NADH:ubiquinone oxidoreductase subunit NDUFA12 [Paracoccus hibiscisoli]